jgi:hypothetical protein
MEAAETRAAAPYEVVVSGRRFASVEETTFEQDIYIMRLLEEAGLRKLAEVFDAGKDNIGDIAHQVILTAYTHGRLFSLLGAVMEEEGVTWTPEVAERNAKFFSQLRSPEDKGALKNSIVAVILGFFVSGLLSSKTSQKSSAISLETIPQSSELSEETTRPEEGLATLESGTPS